MTLNNAIAIIRRQDAQVKVQVPATQNHKAYSYMREGSNNPSTPKSGVNKKAIAFGVGGAIAGGALTAGILAMRRAKKGGEDEVKAKTGSNDIDAESREVSNAVKGASSKGAIAEGQPTQRKKPIVTPPPVSSDRVLVTPQPKSTSIVDKKKKNFISKGVENIKGAVQKGVERDRKASGAFTDKEIDLNKVAYNVGKKSRKAVENLASLAKDAVENIKKRSKTVATKATEVEDVLPEGKPMKKVPKPKSSKKKLPTAAEIKATQKQLDDLNK